MNDGFQYSQSRIDLDVLVDELLEFAKQERSLHQFETRVSARQYQKIYQLVLKYIAPNSTVLDWGAGNGHFSYFLVKAGYQTSGYGFESLPKICRVFSPERYTYQQGDWSDPIAIPFPDEQFDAVLSVGVLEHVREMGGDEIASLKEIYRMLKPNGLFICVHFPNRYSWIEYAARTIEKWSHQYCYTEPEIQSLVQRTKFRMLEIERYAFLPRNVWSKLPESWGNSYRFSLAYDTIDRLLSIPFSHICQNYLFVAQK